MRKNIIISVLLSFAAAIFAQQTKQFTLEELIPGGKLFYNYYPRIATQYRWYGNRLVSIENDSIFVAENPENPQTKSFFIGYKELVGQDERVTGVVFPKRGNSVQFFTTKGVGLLDADTKQLQKFFNYPEGSENHLLSPDNNVLAYTKGNNLYAMYRNGTSVQISFDENRGIVSGQAVHRNEFGIEGGIFWSGDGKKLAFYRMDETMVSDYPLVDVSAREAKLKAIKYPMAGMTSHHVTIGVFDLKTQQTIYLETGEPKDHYLTNVAWSADGKEIYVAELNREQNHMKLNRYDATSGKLNKTLFEERHPKYVEPQHPVLFADNNPSQFIWQSNREGYNHLYLYKTDGTLLKQLTSGEWEVTDVIGFDAKGQNLFFASTHPTPTDRHIYSVNLKTGKTSRHTSEAGMHAARLSASGQYLIDRYSAHDNPGTIRIIDINKKRVQRLASAKNPFEGFDVPTVELGTLKAADGETDLYYRMLKPTDFDPMKKYPVAVYVYGGPHSQMVQNRWRYDSGGWEMYMAQKGYVVFVMDNRGTAYRGAAFENATHRRLGVEEAKDQMCGVKFLKSLPYVDAERIGVHGWSYGGFMTITLLLDYPDVFKVGVAGGPVIDWKYYEVMYGERYMDTPEENPQGYEKTSLLNKADKLKSRLLIIHGDEDPTVVMQNSLQFLKSCITAGTHPDFFVYPGHGHNMMGRDRVHLHEHITRYFEDFCKSEKELQ